MTGQAAIVTGGGRGLGQAICQSLAEGGAFVVVADIDEKRAEHAARALRDAGWRATPAAVDVADERSVTDLLQRADHRLDIVVNCAGIDHTVSIEELQVGEWDRILSVNLRGPFLVSRTAMSCMRPVGRGHIVNIVSTAAKRAWANASAYHASKWGLLGFSHALHVEARPLGIKVTAVVCGGMCTPFLLDRFSRHRPHNAPGAGERGRGRALRRVDAGRVGDSRIDGCCRCVRPRGREGPWRPQGLSGRYVMSRAIFLDKDGTLLKNVPFNVDPALAVMTPGAEEALGRLARLGFDLVVVSNQPGVALGYFELRGLDPIRSELERRFRLAGAHLAGFYVCPHHPEAQGRAACTCRKPKPGLLYRAAADLGVSLSGSWLVGDILDDVEAGRAAGCRTILLDNGHETEWQVAPLRQPHFLAADLGQAAAIIESSGADRLAAAR